MRLPPSFIHSLFFRNINLLRIAQLILLIGILPVSGFAYNSQLVCTPTGLRFGDVVLGQTETLYVTVTNSGSTSVTISQVAVANSAFTTSYWSLPLVLLPGQSAGLNVSFTPSSMGWASSTIKFSSSASTTILQVSGTGVNSQGVVPSPPTVSFGQVATGTTSSAPVVLTNNHSWRVTLLSPQATGSGFSMSGPSFPVTLAPGQSITVKAIFAPRYAGTSGGSLFVPGPGVAIPLSGTGVAPGQLNPNPASLNFGSVQSGGNVTLMDSLTNTGTSGVTISQATISGAGFSMSGLTLPLLLNPGASVTFSVMFAPQSSGNATGGITVNSDASDSSLNISLAGTGTAPGQLIIAPTAVNLGNVTVGTSASQTNSITASGASVTLTSASINSSEFSLSGISFPMTIRAGQSVLATVTFAPQTSGTDNAVLSVTSNAGNNPTQPVSGVGVAQAQHTVALSWNGSGSGVAGYNVYRGAAHGGPYTQINSGLDASTTYTDDSVQSGQTYYYVTTAVNESGAESSYSNEAQGVIPTP